jgi:hypothetical protein
MTDTIDIVFPKELEKLGAEIEEHVASFSLADAIRMGSSVTEKATNWGSEGNACTMTAAAIAIRAMQEK